MSRRFIFIVFVSFIICAFACSRDSQNIPNDIDIIKKSYDEWLNATNAKDIDKWSIFLDADAVFLPPDSQPLESIDDIKDYYINLFKDPSSKLECDQVFVEVAKSRDIAWSRGVCKATFSTVDGNIGTGASKWTKVWIRQADGTWKCKLNTWNQNQSN